MMEKPIYMTIPIELLQDIHSDSSKTVLKMAHYGIYDRAVKMFPDLEEIGSYEIESSCEYFNLKKLFIDEKVRQGKDLYNKFSNRPNASVSRNILFDFQDGKKESELMAFCAYCALRSMVGTKSYLKTNNEYLLSRMFGYATKDEYLNEIPNDYGQSLRVKYAESYHLDKIKETLQAHWGLVYYSRYTRGFYVSFKVDLVTLINLAEDKKDKYKLKEMERKSIIQSTLLMRKNQQNLSKN